MKKTLMTLMTVGALTVPVGALVAEADPIEPADPTPTTVQPERDRDRERRHVDDAAMLGEQRSDRADDCPVDGTPAREREQIRVAEGTGEGRQMHERDQVRVEQGPDAGVTETPDDGVTETPADTPAENPDVTDDGANLQFRYGAGSGPGNR